MQVLINALQAGNLSGTGRYVEELCRALPGADPELETTLIWPAVLHKPVLGPRTDCISYPAGLKDRLFFDHCAVGAMATRKAAQVLHYPASTGCLRPPRPMVQTIHDLCFLTHPEWFPRAKNLYYRYMIAATAKKADIILTDSHASADDIQSLLHIPQTRIRVIPLGVSTAFYPRSSEEQARVRGKYRLPERFFLYVGTIEPRKNLVRLVQAWDKAVDAGLPPLVIAGRQGWKADPIYAAIKQARHAADIHQPGFIENDDLPALLSAATAFVWPSLMEGFGLPPLEAMACGVPVLTSDTSSLPEVTGNAALLVDPTNESAMAGALLALATDERLQHALAESGPLRARQFTWSQTARLTAAAYHDAART